MGRYVVQALIIVPGAGSAKEDDGSESSKKSALSIFLLSIHSSLTHLTPSHPPHHLTLLHPPHPLSPTPPSHPSSPTSPSLTHPTISPFFTHLTLSHPPHHLTLLHPPHPLSPTPPSHPFSLTSPSTTTLQRRVNRKDPLLLSHHWLTAWMVKCWCLASRLDNAGPSSTQSCATACLRRIPTALSGG